MSSGAKIIEGLKDAVAGNFSSVTIEGQHWVRADWQPIETAPKDGTFILLHCAEDGSRWLASWSETTGEGSCWFGCDEHGLRRSGQSAGDSDYVTGWFVNHWMSLPSPPVQER